MQCTSTSTTMHTYVSPPQNPRVCKSQIPRVRESAPPWAREPEVPHSATRRISARPPGRAESRVQTRTVCDAAWLGLAWLGLGVRGGCQWRKGALGPGGSGERGKARRGQQYWLEAEPRQTVPSAQCQRQWWRQEIKSSREDGVTTVPWPMIQPSVPFIPTAIRGEQTDAV